MKQILYKLRSSMSVNVIGSLIGLMLLFGIIVCFIGNLCFFNAFQKEYSTVTYHMADSAAVFVNGNHINAYLEGKETEEYEKTRRQLNLACQKLNVSLIYVIQVDESDYGRFLSVFNSVNNSVDNTEYKEWPLGYQRDTTNDEYKEIYRKLYHHESVYETLFRTNTKDGSHPHITTLVPIKNRDGDVKAILCVQRPIREMVDAFMPYVLLILGGVLIMGALICVLSTVFIRKAIINPIKMVSKETTRFAKESTKGELLGEISQYEVMRNLAHAIDSMETDMVNYTEHLAAVTAEKERASAELSIAATIQSNSLPDVFPPFPDRHEFDIFASMDPAKEIGGDFYNFLLIDEDHLALVIADVSGKGVPAALFMMVSNILIGNRAQMGGTPAQILQYVNDAVCKHNTAEMFVTVWLGILQISTGKLTAANAGHEYPAICRKNGCFELLKDKHGFVIGGMEGVCYKDYDLQLNKGDKLFLYTDGLPEATDSNQDMYSVERMIQDLNRYKDQAPQDIIEGLQKSVSEFVGNAPQFDDLTMMCIEITDEKADE